MKRWVLQCHKAVNNVLGHIGVLVDLRRQTATQLRKATSEKKKYALRGSAWRGSHRFHFKGKQHVLHVWRHLVLGGSGSVLDGIKNKLAVVTHPAQQQ